MAGYVKNKYTLPLLALLLFVASGCIYSREIAQTRRDLEAHYPEARFEREMVVNFGPLSLKTLGLVSKLSSDEDVAMARRYMNEIRRVKVGVYRVEQAPDLDAFDPPALRRFQRDGWELALKNRDDEQVVWVLYKERKGHVRDLYAIVLSEEELVLARVKGHLDRLLARVLEDHYALDSFVEDLE